MKLLTLNFLTCARKTCKSSAASFPLHPKEAELEQVEIEMNPLLVKNMLPRLDWEAMKTLTTEVPAPYDACVTYLTNATCSSVYQICQQRRRVQRSLPQEMANLRRHSKICIRFSWRLRSRAGSLRVGTAATSTR